ncbi:MAG: chloride channel protein [Candidatus Binatia bacterium]
MAAATTVGLGGSQGFESPSALIGASWSQLLARWSASDDTRRTLLAAGASAGIAAVFSSPAIGALYGIEVPYRRDVDAPRLAPCAVAAVAAYLVRDALIGTRPLISVGPLPPIDATYVAACAAVAVACGLGALFAGIEEWLRAVGRRQTRGQRAAIGGVALMALAAAGWQLSGAWITFGPGYVAADWLAAGAQPLWLIGAVLAVRAAGNLVCVYGGGGGGVFTSLACNGAFIGQLIAEAIGAARPISSPCSAPPASSPPATACRSPACCGSASRAAASSSPSPASPPSPSASCSWAKRRCRRRRSRSGREGGC